EPEDGRLTLLARDLVHAATVADAVAQVGELAEALDQRLLVGEAAFEARPERFARDGSLQLPQVGVLELAGERRVALAIQRGVLLRSYLQSLLDLLQYMRRELGRIAVQGLVNASSQGQFDGLDPRVQLPELGREVQALLHQQVLDRVLNRALAF